MAVVGLEARDGVLLILMDTLSVVGGPSEAKSQALHSTSKANPGLISVGICEKRD